MLPNLVSLAGFQQRAGMTNDELQTAAFAGILPKSVGVIDGIAFWLESDVAQFITEHRKGQSAPVAAAVIEPPPSLAQSEPDRASVADLTKLERTLIASIDKVNESLVPAKWPAVWRSAVPLDLVAGTPTLNESAQRAQYTDEQIAAYFGVSTKQIGKRRAELRPPMKHAGIRNRLRLYSHGEVMRLWNSSEWHAAPTRGIVGHARLASWVDAIRDHLAMRQAGASNVAPLNTVEDCQALSGDEKLVRAARKELGKLAMAGKKEGKAQAAAQPAAHVPSVETFSVLNGQTAEWMSERAVSDVLDLPLEVIRIIRKDRIGPAFAYRDGNLQYRRVDVLAWQAANLPVIEGLRGNDNDVWLTYPQAAQLIGISVSSLQRICSPSYKGPNPGPLGVTRDKQMMFKRSAVVAWKTHHRHVIERHERESALRGEQIREAQKLAVIAKREKREREKRVELGLPEPARRLLDPKSDCDIGARKLVKKEAPADPLRDAMDKATTKPASPAAMVKGRATMAELLAAGKH